MLGAGCRFSEIIVQIVVVASILTIGKDRRRTFTYLSLHYLPSVQHEIWTPF